VQHGAYEWWWQRWARPKYKLFASGSEVEIAVCGAKELGAARYSVAGGVGCRPRIASGATGRSGQRGDFGNATVKVAIEAAVAVGLGCRDRGPMAQLWAMHSLAASAPARTLHAFGCTPDGGGYPLRF